MKERVVLVYGARKSGTTLTQRLLDGSELFTHPSETKIKGWGALKKKIDAGIEIPNDTLRWYFQRGSNNKQNPAELQELRDSFGGLKTLRDYIVLDLDLCLKYNKHEAGWRNSGAIIKEVGGQPGKVIQAFLDSFDNGLVVLVLRDPRYTSSAVFRQRRSVGRKLSVRETLKEAKEPFVITRALCQMRNKERTMISFYEKTVEDPAGLSAAFKEFACLDRRPEPVPTLNGTNVAVRTASIKGDAHRVIARKGPWYSGLGFLEIALILWHSVLNVDLLIKLRRYCREK